jgi:predicted outer membrane repeat protein
MFLNCQASASQNCNVTFNKANRFIGNSAEIQGGAISFRSSGFKDPYNTTLYSENVAKLINGAISRYPSKIKVELDISTITVVNVTINTNLLANGT